MIFLGCFKLILIMSISEDQKWNIIRSHFEYNGFVKHQTHSFDDFIVNGIARILEEEPDIIATFEGKSMGENVEMHTYRISFDNPYISHPTVLESDRTLRKPTPCECRQRNLTYDSPVYVDITETNENTGESTLHRRVVICRIPIMLRSSMCHLNDKTPKERIQMGECEWDFGGYFIVKGNERVLINQQRNLYNKVLVVKGNANKDPNTEYIAEMRSMSEETGHSVSISAKLFKDKKTTFEIPYTKNGILVGILFKALGFIEEEQILELINMDKSDKNIRPYLVRIFRDSFHICSQEDALNYIGRFSKHIIKENERIEYAKQIVERELFPHLGVSSNAKQRGLILGQMLNKLFKTKLGIRTEDNRDNYKNKRIETAGMLCYDLFRTLYKRLLSNTTMKLEKKKQKPDIVSMISKEDGITKGLRSSFSIGNWGAQKNQHVKQGVSQILSRLTYGATLSHLRRLMLQIGKQTKNTKMRQPDPSQFMFICPVETPEGGKVGVVLNLALTAQITTRVSPNLVRDVLDSMDEIKTNIEIILTDEVRIFLNGIIIGVTDVTEQFLETFKELRNCLIIPKSVSIAFDKIDNEINIYSDEGRIIRPILRVENNELLLSEEDGCDWEDLVEKDLVTYVDNSELDDAVIAMDENDLKRYKCDYCEISPTMILGVMAAMIPYPDHSQSPRNLYQSAMGKQAMGIPNLAHLHRTDTVLHVLDYPQKPLVSTKPSQIMGFNDMPSGINAIVAIMCHSGFNQEDSILMNKSAIERGLFSATTYRCHVTEEERKNNVLKKVCIPPLDKQKNNLNYRYLDENGIVKVGTYVNDNDVLVGKICIESDKSGDERITECSLLIKKGQMGYIDRVYDTIKPDGYRLVKIVIRTQKIPEVGDKFASRAAQKGTLGMHFRQEDMPFTADGMVPDIIVNLHAIPSRMTINQLMECVLGKSCTIDGGEGDCTPFDKNSATLANDFCDRLEKNGMERHGNEVMYSGLTGKKLEATIFMGPTYYQRLKHLVSEKMHARPRGQVTTLTRQPTEGRQRDGGLKFGEMDRDCMISHGNSAFLKERLFDQSDPFQVTICDKCGNFASDRGQCRSCETDQVTRVNLAYSSKLVLQELNAMGIKTSITTK